MKQIFAILILFFSTSSFADAISNSSLAGVWKLVKSENPMPDGHLVSYCNGVHGYIIYTADGFVSVSLNCGPEVGTSEPADISGRKFFYTGTYSIVGSVITHHIENASDVNLIGTNSIRTALLSSFVLTLTGVNQGQEFSAYWQKLDDGSNLP